MAKAAGTLSLRPSIVSTLTPPDCKSVAKEIEISIRIAAELVGRAVVQVVAERSAGAVVETQSECGAGLFTAVPQVVAWLPSSTVAEDQGPPSQEVR